MTRKTFLHSILRFLCNTKALIIYLVLHLNFLLRKTTESGIFNKKLSPLLTKLNSRSQRCEKGDSYVLFRHDTIHRKHL